MNVKQLRLRSFSEQPVSMRLDVSSKREVTAAGSGSSQGAVVVKSSHHRPQKGAALLVTITMCCQYCGSYELSFFFK
jgi:hypothetical protein